MTLDVVRLSTPLQALVDARLDTIERMLLGVVPRQDRLAIARDVETQIFEQLQDRGTAELTREDVLAVLATLDPPEAYLPEESDDSPHGTRALPNLPSASARSRSSSASSARVSGILGIVTLIVAILLPIFVCVAAVAFESEWVLLIGGGFALSVVLTGAILSLILAARAGLRKGWAITGLVLSLLTIPALVVASFLSMAVATG